MWVTCNVIGIADKVAGDEGVLMECLRIGSLFSGTGALDLAAMELFPGSQVVWHCEWEAAPAKILDHHWPGVPNFRDVTQVDWASAPPIDILTGGYPCQPFSDAGRRQGTNDERHLWPNVRDALRILRPRFALLENVAGHRTLGFDRVLGDCAEDGFHVRWTSVRASHVGAPHHRERLFILVSTDPESIGFAAGGFPGGAQAEVSEPAGDGGDVVGGYGQWSGPLRRWAGVLGREMPSPAVPNRNGRPQLNPVFAEWLMGLPEGWVTDRSIGLTRSEMLKALGNGVVPAQAVAAFRELLSWANTGVSV